MNKYGESGHIVLMTVVIMARYAIIGNKVLFKLGEGDSKFLLTKMPDNTAILNESDKCKVCSRYFYVSPI